MFSHFIDVQQAEKKNPNENPKNHSKKKEFGKHQKVVKVNPKKKISVSAITG